jgi:hypothetical protein
MMKVDNEQMIPPVTFPDKTGDPVTLERYSADHHGFMRLEIAGKLITGRYYTVPRPQDPYSKGNQLIDYFEFDWTARKYVPNSLPTPDPGSTVAVTASIKGRRVSPKSRTGRATAGAKVKSPRKKKSASGR